MSDRHPDDTEEANYTVKVWRSRRTGVVVMEDWRKVLGPHHKQAHRVGGPQYIERDPDTQIVTLEGWAVDGKSHREDGPAIIKRDPRTGRITSSSWYKDGQLIPKRARPRKSQPTLIP